MNYVNSRINLQLPRAPTVSDSDVYREFMTLYNSLQNLHSQLSIMLGVSGLGAADMAALGLATGLRLGDMNVATVELTETVAANDLINLYDSTGPKARLASKAAATRRPAGGIALDAGVSGDLIRVCLGWNLLAGTFTPGSRLYLSTAGGFSATPTLVVGEVSQLVGLAVSADFAVINPSQPFRVYAHNPQVTMTGSLLQDETGTLLYGQGDISGTLNYYEPVLVPI